ncbi:MAG: hypothetical protein LBS60_02240 [Deltaproteobacteria bacterium]|jgi:hypothetical protein|nr:hypothetical protein [Deltaproteobacteria bacterium]
MKTTSKSNPSKPLDAQSQALEPQAFPSPLAVPVFAAILAPAKEGGLALKSFVNAVLADSHEDPLLSDILTVTIKRERSKDRKSVIFEYLLARGADKEVIVLNAQLTPFEAYFNYLFYFSQRDYDFIRYESGEFLENPLFEPRLISIGLYNDIIRPNVKNFHQIVEFAYREDPQIVWPATRTHLLQLPLFKKFPPDDYTNPLRWWLKGITTAHDRKISLRAAVNLDDNLKNFYQADQGFAQFVDRHERVISRPGIMKSYRLWETNLAKLKK